MLPILWRLAKSFKMDEVTENISAYMALGRLIAKALNSKGKVNVTMKYSTGKRFAFCLVSQCEVVFCWHCGQLR